MKRILTGIQSSGKPHLGNILGAIEPALKLSKQDNAESFFFIADLHSLTTIKDPNVRSENTFSVSAAWLALGLDISENHLYRQSKIPEVCELAWYLGCFMSYSRLSLAHSFKDKSSKLENVNAGLFYYPVLMCADILLYQAEVVPVGKDQKQHVEFTRELAKRYNHHYKKDFFTVPEARIDKNVMIVPGIDGRKMSKSYNNYIDIFDTEKKLKKKVNSIVTQSLPLGSPLDPDTCNVFAIYKLLADAKQIASMREDYVSGSIGFGKAKASLFGLILDKYGPTRAKYDRLISDKYELENQLQKSEEKVRAESAKVLNVVRKELGF